MAYDVFVILTLAMILLFRFLDIFLTDIKYMNLSFFFLALAQRVQRLGSSFPESLKSHLAIVTFMTVFQKTAVPT